MLSKVILLLLACPSVALAQYGCYTQQVQRVYQPVYQQQFLAQPEYLYSVGQPYQTEAILDKLVQRLRYQENQGNSDATINKLIDKLPVQPAMVPQGYNVQPYGPQQPTYAPPPGYKLVPLDQTQGTTVQGSGNQASAEQPASQQESKAAAIVKANCITCHGGAKTEKGIDLTNPDAMKPRLWGMVAFQVQSGLMPPGKPLDDASSETVWNHGVEIGKKGAE